MAKRSLIKSVSSSSSCLSSNLSKAISSRGGMIKELFSMSPMRGDPKVFLSIAVPANPKFLKRGSFGLVDSLASGIGLSLEQANNSAAAEAIERYCASYVQEELITVSSWNKLGCNALHPEDLPLFTKEQYGQVNFPYAPFLEDTTIGWVKGYSYTHQQEKWLPATMVWDAYLPLRHEEQNICFGLMTGSAAGSTWEQAAIGALLEVIERDSFMIAWYNRLSPTKLDIGSSGIYHMDAFKPLFDKDRFELHLMDVTSDLGIPAVFGLLKTLEGKICIGGSAKLSMAEAVKKAMFEISQLYMGNKTSIFTNNILSILPEEVTEYAMRLPYYAQPNAAEEMEFIYASNSYRPVNECTVAGTMDEQQQLQYLVNKLAEKGLEVIAVDLTTEDVKELGIHVVKMVVPGMVELPRNENERILTSKRIYSVPVDLGVRTVPSRRDELNASPHPFP